MARKAGNAISRRLAEHARANRYIKAQAADFGRLYDAARQEIDKRLRKEAVSAAERGTIPQSARLLAAIEQVYPRLEAAYREKFNASIPYVAQSAHFMALQDLQLGGREFDKKRVALTLEDAYTHVAGMTANMKKKDVAFLRQTVAGVEREAAMTGMTSRQVSAELLTRLESRPEGFKFVDAGNRVWDSRAYSEMLARTTLLNTSRQEYLNTCAENGADVVCVTVSGHCCDKCAEWENRLLSISGATKGLPTVDDAIAAGLFHPNCTHSLTEVDDYTREEEYNPDGTPKTGEDREDASDRSAALGDGVLVGGGNGAQYSMFLSNRNNKGAVDAVAPLEQKEKSDIYDYTGPKHKRFNEYLAGDKKDLSPEQCREYDRMKASLRAAINKYEVRKEIEVFRGVGGDFAKNMLGALRQDGKLEINSFQSTTVDPARALFYAGKYGHSADDRVILKVKLMPGTHALPIGEEGLSQVPADHEVLTKDSGEYIFKPSSHNPRVETMKDHDGKPVLVTVVEVEYGETN